MSDQKGNASRRLSFAEDVDSVGEFTKRPSYQAPSMDRRQSRFNPGGSDSIRRRNSIVGRRLSNSFDSRKSSSQDAAINRKLMQNTYRTEPNQDEIFQPFRLEPKIREILESSLKGKKYDSHMSPMLAKELTQDISREAHCLASRRYKLVTHVVVGEYKGQDLRLASRCLWDSNFDNMASAYYKNSSVYAVGTVFAVYFE